MAKHSQPSVDSPRKLLLVSEARVGQIGLNTVPGERDQPADHRRDIGAEDAKRLTADNGVWHPGHLARLRHQVSAQLHNTDADQQAEQNLPAGQSKRKEARRYYVAAHAVHVRHPE